MARQKKAMDKYHIDFKFPERTRDLLLNEEGKYRYTIPEMIEYASQRNDSYAKDFCPSVKAYFEKNGELSSNQLWTLGNIAVYYTPAYLEVQNKFFEWYDSREDIRELYTNIANISYWFYDKQGQHMTNETAKSAGYMDRPDSWYMFDRIINSWEGNRYRELNRDVVYDVGDLVVVRKPFVGNYLHDPCYGKVDTDTERVGTVAQHTENLYRRSRGGKGSRMINVIWINTGETKAVPERILKKHKMK